MIENKIRERRRELGMTLLQLSKESGVPLSTLAEIEEKGREPRVRTAQYLAHALLQTIDELWPIT